MKGMKMRDMKRVADECCVTEMPRKKKKTKEYPWSMNVNLQTEDMKTLDIDVSEMKTGDKMYLHAEVEVTSLEVSERDGKKRQSMTIQMQQMDLVPKKDMKMNEAKEDY
ncbi:MAG: hypothetical protein KAV87_28105 [Desulfobacteraceae bacterium]|nr:hypothetical protein [Desulfobacteraceae bacterium]